MTLSTPNRNFDSVSPYIVLILWPFPIRPFDKGACSINCQAPELKEKYWEARVGGFQK